MYVTYFGHIVHLLIKHESSYIFRFNHLKNFRVYNFKLYNMCFEGHLVFRIGVCVIS